MLTYLTYTAELISQHRQLFSLAKNALKQSIYPHISNRFRLNSFWLVEGRTRDIFALLSDVGQLKMLWPAAFVDVKELATGDENGVGKAGWVRSAGFLPYNLEWYFRVIEAHNNRQYIIEAWGDFEGQGTWVLKQHGNYVAITFDWHVRVEKPIVRFLCKLCKPLLVANHRWAMTKGEKSLQRALKAYRSRTLLQSR